MSSHGMWDAPLLHYIYSPVSNLITYSNPWMSAPISHGGTLLCCDSYCYVYFFFFFTNGCQVEMASGIYHVHCIHKIRMCWETQKNWNQIMTTKHTCACLFTFIYVASETNKGKGWTGAWRHRWHLEEMAVWIKAWIAAVQYHQQWYLNLSTLISGTSPHKCYTVSAYWKI